MVLILPENRKIIETFLLVQTQWRYVEGRPVGLDYAACAVVLNAMGQKISQLMAGLQIMELEIVKQVWDK